MYVLWQRTSLSLYSISWGKGSKPYQLCHPVVNWAPKASSKWNCLTFHLWKKNKYTFTLCTHVVSHWNVKSINSAENIQQVTFYCLRLWAGIDFSGSRCMSLDHCNTIVTQWLIDHHETCWWINRLPSNSNIQRVYRNNSTTLINSPNWSMSNYNRRLNKLVKML